MAKASKVKKEPNPPKAVATEKAEKPAPKAKKPKTAVMDSPVKSKTVQEEEYIDLFVCLFIYLFIYLMFHVFIYLCVHSFIHSSIYLFIHSFI